jgi:nucleoside-diphosphate-sugar epimerase
LKDVLVTGASGFVGSHLAAELERRGIPFRAPRVELGPDADWGAALEGVDRVVHLAALAHDRVADKNLMAVNAQGTAHLAQAAAAAGVRHFIFTSTIGVQGEETFGEILTEASPLAPRSRYAESKLEAERLLAGASLPVTVLRPTLVYGPRNPGNMLRLLRWVDRAWPLPLATVRNRRSLTYVGNLVSAIVAVLDKPLAGTFIVCDAQPISTPALVRELAMGLGRPARLVPFPVIALPRRIAGSLEADASKLCRELQWRQPLETAEALRRTASWYRDS